MRVSSINNVSNIYKSKTSFKRASGSVSGPEMQEPEKPRRKSGMSTLGNMVYAGLLINTLAINPLMYKSYVNTKEQEYKQYQTDAVTKNTSDDMRNVFLEDGKTSNAFYQYDRFNDVEMPKLNKLGENLYNADFKLADKNIGMTISTKDLENNELSGEIYIKTPQALENYDYKITFDEKKSKNFDIELTSKADSTTIKKTIERDRYGELYILDGEDKIQINKEALSEYEEKKDIEETTADMEKGYNELQKFNYLVCLIATLIKLGSYTPPKKKEED